MQKLVITAMKQRMHKILVLNSRYEEVHVTYSELVYHTELKDHAFEVVTFPSRLQIIIYI